MTKMDIGSFVPIIGTTWASELGTGEEGVVNELLKDAEKDGTCYLDIWIWSEDKPVKSFKSAAKIDLNTSSSLVCWDPPLENAPFPGWRDIVLQAADDILGKLKARYKKSS